MKRLPTDAWVIVIILAVAAITALSLGDDYGQSWDEASMYLLGKATIRSYITRTPLESLPSDFALYGPLFPSISEWMTSLLMSLAPRLALPDAHHISYFFSFMIAVISVYAISRGFVSPGPAATSAILFATQPLLFGHAFINPKDMPFLAFGAASIMLGMLASRALPPGRISLPLNSHTYQSIRHRFFRDSIRAWSQVHRTRRIAYIGFLILAVISAYEFLISRSVILPSIETTIRQAYSGDAALLIQSLFNRLATRATLNPVEAYIHKATVIYEWISALTVVLMAVVALAWTFIILRKPISEAIFIYRSFCFESESIKDVPAKKYLKDFSPSFILLLLAAGITLGLTIAIRPVAPFAGALVTFLLILRVRRLSSKALAVGIYWLVAIMFAYLSWPFLWGAPLSNFLRAYRTMMDFPWFGTELFHGLAFHVHELPNYYAPFHFLIQITLPAITLGLIGSVIAVIRPRSLYYLAESLVLWAWMAIPIFFAVEFRTPLYDSARQLLFSLTPFFIMSALSIHWVASKVRLRPLRLLLAALMITPGIIGIVRLHPYEYIYYNELVGGVAGANRVYELDYWGTSFREAMEYLTLTAPLGSRIAVPFLAEMAWPYAREDFELLRNYDADDSELPDFVVVTTRGVIADAYWPTAPTYYIVQREGAPLAIIRDLREMPPHTPP